MTSPKLTCKVFGVHGRNPQESTAIHDFPGGDFTRTVTLSSRGASIKTISSGHRPERRGEERESHKGGGGEWPRYPRSLLFLGSRSSFQDFLEVTKSCQEFLSLCNQSLGLGQEHVRI